MKRIYHHYTKCEEFSHGMWKTITGEKRLELLQKAIKFTSDANLYGEWMIKVVENWKYSCEHNLSEKDMNRQAWIGHAAVCLALGIPDHADYDLESKGKVPSWRRLCKTLLRNDYWCKGIGFSPTKSQAYSKYLKLMRKKRNQWELFND